MQKSQGGARWPARLATCRLGTGGSTNGSVDRGEGVVHRSMVDQGQTAGACGLGGTGSSCAGAIAGSDELTVGALQGMAGRSEGTGA